MGALLDPLLPALGGSAAFAFGGGVVVAEGLAGDALEGVDGEEAGGGIVAVEHADQSGDGGRIFELGGLDDGGVAGGGLGRVEVGGDGGAAGGEEAKGDEPTE